MAGRSTIARTWWEQAEADLEAACDSAEAGHHEWSCFQAQQAAEKALKALLYLEGRTAVVTHSLRRLARECVASDPSLAELEEPARLLDPYYIQTRYPNGLDEETAPARYYDAEDSRRCIQSARSILERVRPRFAS